jgi:hypothetical protein
MLVNAKINLQNAADLAAYSGAATQARQLNQISFLNYEMRRFFKKFLFRYYVIGNMAQGTHPANGGSGMRRWAPNTSAQEFGVPATCITYSKDDNYCQNPELKAIPIRRTANPLDQISPLINQQLENIEKLRQNSCLGIGSTNVKLLYYWLWNTDPDLSYLDSQINGTTNPAAKTRLQLLKVLSQGLGLIPKELLLLKRIRSLEKLVNTAPKVLTLSTTERLKSAKEWAANERSVNAFYSAYHTLGSNTYPSETIKLTELLPGDSDKANLLSLQEIKTEFDAWSVDFALKNSNGTASCDNPGTLAQGASTTPSDCFQCLVPVVFSKDQSFMPTVGVYKDPKIMTYYAVELEAKAKVLFSPFGDMTLKAYASTQPFGSRIGPALDLAKFSYNAVPKVLTRSALGGFRNAKKIPNLPVREAESADPTQGWNNNEVLYNYYKQAALQQSGGTTGQVNAKITREDLERAYHSAMGPNPWESGKYNILNDQVKTGDSFINYFDQTGNHAFYAPVGDPDKIQDEIKDFIENIKVNDDPTSQAAFSREEKELLTKGILHYVQTSLKNGAGEYGESLEIYRISNPFKVPDPRSMTTMSQQDITGLPPTLYMSEAEKLRTSWSDTISEKYKSEGRVGYSVKFIPLKTLRNPSGITTDGTQVFTNRLPSGDINQYIDQIQH